MKCPTCSTDLQENDHGDLQCPNPSCLNIDPEDYYEYDVASGHSFCKDCGTNFLKKTHKDDCKFKDIEPPLNLKTLLRELIAKDISEAIKNVNNIRTEFRNCILGRNDGD
jgi:hypothetical protein